MPLVAFVLLAVVCVALLGFACACLTEQLAQAIDRAISIQAMLPPLIEIWTLFAAAGIAAGFRLVRTERPSGRASPALLQRFLF